MCGQYGLRAMTSHEDDAKKSVDSQLAELQREYIANLYERVAPVLAAWQVYVDGGYESDLLKEVYRGVHAIAGTSSILNVSPVDNLSQKAQAQVQCMLQASAVDLSLVSEIAEILNEMLRVAKSGDVEAPPINLNG